MELLKTTTELEESQIWSTNIWCKHSERVDEACGKNERKWKVGKNYVVTKGYKARGKGQENMDHTDDRRCFESHWKQ